MWMNMIKTLLKKFTKNSDKFGGSTVLWPILGTNLVIPKLVTYLSDVDMEVCIFEALRVFFIGPRCPWGPIYGSGSLKLRMRRFADLTDVTLVDEDNKSILTYNANRAIQGNQAIHVT